VALADGESRVDQASVAVADATAREGIAAASAQAFRRLAAMLQRKLGESEASRRETAARLERDLADAEAREGTLTQTVQRLEAELQRVVSLHRAAAEQLSTCEMQRSALQAARLEDAADLARAREAERANAQRVDELLGDALQRMQQLQAAESQLREAQQREQETLLRLGARSDELQIVQAAARALELQLESARMESAALAATLDRRDAALAAAEQQLAEARLLAQRQADDLGACAERCARLEEQCGLLQRRVSDKDAELSHLTTQHALLQESADRDRRVLQSVRALVLAEPT
jgi:exonuclease SbcC